MTRTIWFFNRNFQFSFVSGKYLHGFLFPFFALLQIIWGKVLHPSQTEEITVDGSTHYYIFKNLFSSTAYTFIVKAKNGAGEAMQYQKPSVKRTHRG